MRTNLLPALFDTAEPLQSILQRFEVDVHELMDYLEDHTSVAHLQRLAAFTNRRTRMLLANLKLKALGILDRVISGDPSITEPVRKAASQILRTREEHLAIPLDDDLPAPTDTNTNTTTHTDADPTIDAHIDTDPIDDLPAPLIPDLDTDSATAPAPAPAPATVVHEQPVALRLTTETPQTPRYPVAPVTRRASADARTRTRFKKRKR